MDWCCLIINCLILPSTIPKSVNSPGMHIGFGDQMQTIKRNWNLYNLRLVNRGRPSNYLLPAVENRENDLKVMNKGKVGRPYQYSNVEIFAAYAIKCIFKLGYREASGIVEDFEQQYGVDNTPNFRTIHWRIKKLRKEIISISILATICDLL